MFILYDLIFLTLSIFYLPRYFLKRKFHPGFKKRLAIGIPKKAYFKNPVWVHAVSVGEAMSVKNLVACLKGSFKEKQFVFSTVTATGNKIASALSGPEDFVTYLPLDFSFTVRAGLDRINPSLFIIAETEIWPNLISYLYRKKVPIIVVNGRISDKSFFGYSCIKIFLRPILQKISFFCVQSECDRSRLIALGVSEEKIKVTGNMKFDLAASWPKQETSVSLVKRMNLPESAKLFVAASTHPGEEEIIIGSYRKLLRHFPGLILLFAPRHPERSKDIAKITSINGMRPVFISDLADNCSSCLSKPVFILDSIGQLMDFYGIADIVFVGGSLVKKGGHNILEPASMVKPVIFGPHMFNFRDIAEAFLKNKACVQVNNGEELEQAVADLLQNPSKREALCNSAKEVIFQNQGASRRNCDLIKNCI